MTVARSIRRAMTTVGLVAAVPGLIGGIYLNLIGVAAARQHRGATAGPAPAARRFRIVVPAHDEAEGIADTLESLNAVSYPQDRFEIHVVADNCSDDTAAIATALGVAVHERTDLANRGKGAALAWLIDRLPAGADDDAIVIVDADTIVSPELLNAFDRELETGVAAVQGHYRVRDAASGGDVGFRAAALAVRHFARPAGRTGLGGSSALYGNGMAFREDIARTYRWANTLTEDLEMATTLLLDGHLVGFAAEADVQAEMPTTLDAAESQNQRWEAGRFEVARTHVPALLRASRERRHGRRWAYLDAAADLTLLPMTMLLASSLLSGLVLLVFGAGRTRTFGVAAAAAASTAQITHVAHALQLSGAPPEVRRSLARTPIHMLWKARLIGRVSRRQPDDWVRTTRNDQPIEAA